MKTYKTEGIIIKRKNFAESDRLLTVFTKRNGKIKVKASGVRKISSRRSPHIELLNYSYITLYEGRSLPILTEAQTIEDYSQIKGSLKKIGFAYYMCELIDGLCPENQENNTVFSLFEESLRRLCLEKDIVSVVREFQVDLLVFLGFYKRKQISQRNNVSILIEGLLERKLKTRQTIAQFSR